MLFLIISHEARFAYSHDANVCERAKLSISHQR